MQLTFNIDKPCRWSTDDITWTDIPQGTNTVTIPDGTKDFYIESDEDVTTISFNSDTYKNINIEIGDTITSLQGSCLALKELRNFTFTDPCNVTNMQNTFTGCENLLDVQMDISKVTNFTGAFENVKRATHFGDLNTSSGEIFDNMFKGCQHLQCLKSIDTSNQTSTTDMFLDTPSMLRPNPTEITQIESGTSWSNPDACPAPDSLDLTFTTDGTSFTVYVDGNGFYDLGDGNVQAFTPGDISGTPAGTGEVRIISEDTTQVKWSTNNIKTVRFDSAINLTSAQGMLENQPILETFEMYGTNKILDWSYAFYYCPNVVFKNKFDISLGEKFNKTFQGCDQLRTLLDIDFSSGKSFDSTFADCQNLEQIGILDTALGENFNNMFRNCVSLQCLGGIDTRNQTIMIAGASGMFENCPLLTAPDATEQADLTDANGALYVNPNTCPNWVFDWELETDGSESEFNIVCSNAGDEWYVEIDGGTRARYLGSNSNFKAQGTNIRIFSANKITQVVSLSDTIIHSNLVHGESLTTLSGIHRYRSKLETFQADMHNSANGFSLWHAFENCTSLVTCTFSNLKPGAVLAMDTTWSGCTSLTNVPVTDLSGMTKISYCWSGCTSLPDPFPALDFSGIELISGTFRNTTFTSFASAPDFSNVTSASYAFEGQKGLTSMKIDMPKATTIRSIFDGATELQTITELNVPLCKNMDYAFRACKKLISVENITFGSMESLVNTFFDCWKLEYLPSWDTSTVINYQGAFRYCSALVCMNNLDTSQPGCVKTNMLVNVPSLVQPDATAIADLTDTDGAVWTNSNPCPTTLNVYAIDANGDRAIDTNGDYAEASNQ